MILSEFGQIRVGCGVASNRVKKGYSVAVFAMARKLAILIYRLLKWGQAYVDEGLEAYEARFDAVRLRACKENAKAMGYNLLPIEGVEACA